MGENLLVNEQIDAGANFIRDFNSYAPVSVACWVIPADVDIEYLYIASDNIDDSNIRDAYGEVARRTGGQRYQGLNSFRIKLINSSDPIARDAIGIRDHRPTWESRRYRGGSIGGMGIDGAYIYPPLSAMMNPAT